MKVLSSKYSDKFILVDHIVLFDTDEVTKLKEGDRLRLELYRKDKIAVVTRENGIREESENPKTFTVREELFQLGKIKLEKVSKTPLFETNL